MCGDKYSWYIALTTDPSVCGWKNVRGRVSYREAGREYCKCGQSTENRFLHRVLHRLLATTSVAGYTTRRQHASAECHAPLTVPPYFYVPALLRLKDAQGRGWPMLLMQTFVWTEIPRALSNWRVYISLQSNSAESNQHILEMCESNRFMRKLEGWRRSMHGSPSLFSPAVTSVK